MAKKELHVMQTHPLFSGVDAALLAEALQRNEVQHRRIEAGEIIFSPESPPHTAGILLDGVAAVQTPDGLHPKLLRYLHKGELFGITNLWSGEPFISIIRAKTSAQVLLFTDATMRYLMERDPTFSEHVLSFLSGRIRFLNRKIAYLTAGSAERRLALYLASYETDTIRLSESLSTLSELLDVGRASLYRAFDHLSEDGLLKKNGRTILLTDRETLLNTYQ